MDQLHHELFETLDRLTSVHDHEFCNGYNALVRQVEQTFCKEEQWMEEIDFPSQKAHREQHARVLGALHNVNSRVMSGEIAVGREVVEDLFPQWFAFHASTMDRTLAHALKMARAYTAQNAGGSSKVFPISY